MAAVSPDTSSHPERILGSLGKKEVHYCSSRCQAHAVDGNLLLCYLFSYFSDDHQWRNYHTRTAAVVKMVVHT